jgi:hypothetical protein
LIIKGFQNKGFRADKQSRAVKAGVPSPWKGLRQGTVAADAAA